MKRILFSIFIFVILFNLTIGKAFSQSPAQSSEPGSSDLESCFKYYDYAKVKVNLSTDKSSYSPGEKIKLYGTVVNNNSFPITDIVLYSHLRRINEDENSLVQNGHYLIDRLIIKENLNFLAHETKYLEIEVPVLSTYPGGNYIFQYFIFSKQGFHYSGRSFLEGDNAGATSLSITNDTAIIYFDINNFKVNGNKTDLIYSTRTYEDASFNFEIPIQDNREIKTDLTIKVKYYYFEDDLEILSEKTETYTVKPNDQVLRTRFNIPSNLAAAYVVVAEIDEPVKTVFKYRFIKNGTSSKSLSINDLGISDYPLNENSKAFVCFYSPAYSNAPDTKVRLMLLDNNKNIIEDKSIKSTFPPEVLAISLPLNKITNKNDFYIQTVFTDQTGSRETVKHYSDDLFKDSIKSIDIVYDPNKPNEISVDPKDVTGNKIPQGGLVESIKIKDEQGKTVQENYNLTDFNKSFKLGDLPKGKYKVEIDTGNISTVKEIEIIKDIKGSMADGYVNKDNLTVPAESNQGKQRSYSFIIIFIMMLIAMGIGGYMYWRRLKNKKTQL